MFKKHLSSQGISAWVLGLIFACAPLMFVNAQATPSIPVGTSASNGDANALVTVIEFSDFQCPFCKRVTNTLKQIKDQYGSQVRVVFKHNPLPFHKDAPYASKAAIAAGKQGKFWEMHDKLFINTRQLKPENIKQYVNDLGLDAARFEADLNSKETQAQIDADQALAKKLGARGTPHFFVNGTRLPGALPFDRFKSVIDEEIKAVKALTASGQSAADAYKARVAKNYAAPKPRQPRNRPAADDKTVYNIQPGTSYAKGGSEPLVTIIEFSEFQCPFCSRVLPTMKKIHETYGDQVRVVFKHNPLPFHKEAKPASKAALAAGEQGKFWEMHDLLFANQRKLKPADLEGYATQLGLDLEKFKADMKNPSYDKAIAADQALAAQFGARGTPGFFINGRNLRGAQPFANFKKIIDEEIKKAQALIAKGTARKAVYAALTQKGKTKAQAPQRKPRPSADDKTVYNIQPGPSYAKGGSQPLVTIIEFSEFQCPFCSRVLPTMKKIHETYGDDVRVVFKHNPLSFHKDAMPASQAALAAGEQGKFWEMHDLLFQNQRKLKAADLEGYATKLGLDMAKFKADAQDPRFAKAIKADQALGARFGARGTPNFFINGRNLRGAQPFASFKRIIDEEIKKAKALIAKGTARKDVYLALTSKGKTKAAAPQRRAPKEDNKVYDVKVGPKDGLKGNPKAPVTIVEFSDFQCPFCSRVNPTISKIMKTYGDQVRVVFKHNPLPFHKDAPLASEASLAAGAQGKFWEMHDLLFKNQRKLKRADLDVYATQLGLDIEKFKSDLDQHTFKAQVDADLAQARSLGVRGTPNFFINGKKLTGAQPYERFKAKIDEALKGKKVAAPVPVPAKPEMVKAPIKPTKLTADQIKKLAQQKINPNIAKKLKPLVGKSKQADRLKLLKQLAKNKAQQIEIPVGASPFKGGADALVTIVEFSDFQCPFCSRVTGSLKKINETYGDKVRIVFKHNPLPFHKDAPLASQAAYAAQQQGKFWEMHDKIFSNIRAIKRDQLIAHAQSLGLDMGKFKTDLDSDAAKQQIKRDQALALKLGARGTPHFFINGTRLPGALPFERFKAAIDQEITAVNALVKAGSSVADAYKTRVKKNFKAPEPRKRPNRPAADTKTVYNIAPGKSYAKGGAEPLVTIIEFSEFQCPFCSRVLPTLKKIHETYGDDVRVVFKHNPLPFHKDAGPASKAALAAGEQGKFWEMHDLLFKNQRKLKSENLKSYAAELGLNMDRFEGDLADARFDAIIKADQALGARFGARGTPNFFINGRNLRGAQPFESFKTVIDEEIKKAKALIAQGTPRSGVYAALTAKGKTKAVAPQRRQAPEDNKVYDVQVNAKDAIKGNPKAPVTIVEFSDFQCPFCSRVNPTISKIMKTYGDKVRVVFKHNPLSFHKDAPLASEASLAAGAQGKFWEMHDLLFKNQRKLKRADLDAYAAQLGLDMGKFKADLDQHNFKAQVDADLAQAREIGVRGTPNFFVNGKKLTGAQPFERFKVKIDEALKALKK
jgi:protein-disulfide isomerase